MKYVYNKEFIKGVTPVYYSGPYWDHKEIDAAVDSLKNGEWISSGDKVYEFEQMFSIKFRQKNALMVNSGSSANLLMVKALKKICGWKDGDEVIVSPVGFPTTYSALMESRLQPKFADIEMDTLNFDLDLVEKMITANTVAVFLSPALGNPCDMDRLEDICVKASIPVILDNCDSLGSRWSGKFLSNYAIASSHSFFPAHHISTGEGGMITTNEDTVIKVARSMSWWGRDCTCCGAKNLLPNGSCGNRFSKWIEGLDYPIDHRYYFTEVGFNLRPLDLQGAIGVEQIKKFDEIHQCRRTSKIKLGEILTRNIPGIKTIQEIGKAETSWFGTPVVCSSSTLKSALVKHLECNKVQTRNMFAGNILVHPAYKHLDDYRKYPKSNKVLETVFFIGASPHYRDNVFEYVEDVVKRFSS